MFGVGKGFLLNLQVGEVFEIRRRFLTGPGPPVSGPFSLLTTPDRYPVPLAHHPWPVTIGHHALSAVHRRTGLACASEEASSIFSSSRSLSLTRRLCSLPVHR
jgi:hypothetical protein